MDISVIICTCSRYQSLLKVLNSLETMIIPPQIQWEIVIVDNGSTDGTAALCNGFVSKDPEKYVYINESRVGKSNALNKGIRAARGNIYAFTDDDCVVDQSWLKTIISEYNLDPKLAVLGGRVELYSHCDKPLTLATGSEKVEFSSPRMLFPDPLIIGANMAARKEVFAAVGDFDVLLGPGTNAVAEDVDLVYRAYRKNFKVVYIPSVVVYHNHGRQTNSEIEALIYKYHIGRGAFYFKHMVGGDREIAKMAYWDLYTALKCVFTLKRGARSALRFLRALFTGAKSRIEKAGGCYC